MELWTAFLLGLAGSIHCAGMCGPLALALPQAGRGLAGSLAGRAAYNLGRMVTYCLLGIVLGLLGKTAVLAGLQRTLSIVLGLTLVLGVLATRKFALSRTSVWLVQRLKGHISGLLRRRSAVSLATLGLLNGLLPCGLVYVAGVAAIASGGIFKGALYMVVFGAGTVPMMLAIGLSGRLVPVNLRLRLLKAVPAVVCLLGALLILRGMSLGIPYVSPDISTSHPGCCSSESR